ncbi:MAG: hypothetical protein DRP79_07445 [Planctomycetota bacterium]|nr:MAG: hypothetical protein DRP79_07445 [Planctomycetota bacterium]
MFNFLWAFLNITPSQRAQAMTEYILIIAVVSVAVIAVLIALRGQLFNLFNYVVQKLGGKTDVELEQEEPAEYEGPFEEDGG